MALTETWLGVDVYDSELFPENLVVCRCGRRGTEIKLSRGGGVFLAIYLSIDMVGIKLTINRIFAICIFAVYIPCRITFVDFDVFFNLLNNITYIIISWVILIRPILLSIPLIGLPVF